MDSYNINEIMRAGEVRRWHTVSVHREQTLAEHQWAVTMIAVNIAKHLNMDYKDISAIIDYALVHDMDEIEAGDVPTPAKSRTPRSYNDIEAVVKMADLVEAYLFAKHNVFGIKRPEVLKYGERQIFLFLDMFPKFKDYIKSLF